MQRSGLILFVLMMISGCCTVKAINCSNTQKAAIQEQIYFGTEKPGGFVSAEEWTHFLDEVVTPKFPEGFTVLPAAGQWRSNTGAIVKEPSYLLSIVHADTVAADATVKALIDSYRTQFQQEAVLRVRSNTCISF